jgi:hypothetical protein
LVKSTCTIRESQESSEAPQPAGIAVAEAVPTANSAAFEVIGEFLWKARSEEIPVK